MKKAMIAIVSLVLIASVSLFAGDLNNFNVTSTVGEEAYALTLYKGETAVSKDENFTGDALNVAGDHEITGFTVKATGNQNVQATYTVTVTPSEFKGTINNVADTGSGITPTVTETGTTTTDHTISGKQTAKTIYGFKLSYTGDTSVAAGSYTSAVTVTYSAK